MSRVRHCHSSKVNYTEAASQKYIGSSLSRTVVRDLLACGGEPVHNWIDVDVHDIGRLEGWMGWLAGWMDP